MSHTLFISDLHLDPERPAVTDAFLGFLKQRTAGADALYILGDLFEAWIGDDDDSPLKETVCAGLHACSNAGTAIYFMHGNRDFLVGERFASDSGCTLLEDPHRISLYGTDTLLMHGDLLCTDDTEYLAFRTMVHAPGWQRNMLSRPLAERRQLAAAMRAESRERNAGKPEAIMDVNPDAVRTMMEKYAVQRLIHGHTHRPAIHDLVVNGQPAQRMVLGDWYQHGSLLECDGDGCRLSVLPAG